MSKRGTAESNVEATQAEYKKAIKIKEEGYKLAKKFLDYENYAKAGEIYAQIGDDKELDKCLKGLIKQENYLAAGQLLHFISPKRARQYINDLAKHEGGKYVAEAGMIAAIGGYEKLATKYANQAGERRDYKGAKLIHKILDERREPQEKHEKRNEEYSKAA